MVRFVVEDHDVAHPQEFGNDPLQHLPFRLLGLDGLSAPLKQSATAPGQFDPISQFEGMEVGDDDPRLLKIRQHVVRDQLAALVVAVGVIGLEDAKAVLDGDARSHHQKAIREALALGMPNRIDGLPGDQHRHHRGFACAGRQLERQAGQPGIGVIVDVFEVFQETTAKLAFPGRYLGKPDGRFDRFDLTEEGPDVTEWVVSPVLKEAGRYRGYLPLVGVGDLSPVIDLPSHRIARLGLGLVPEGSRYVRISVYL